MDTKGFALNKGTGSGSTAGLSVSLMRSQGPDADLIPGNGDQCASSTDCVPADYIKPVDQYVNEPFWNDLFVLEVHPQFAYYKLGAGQDEIVQRGADPDTADITVSQLDSCAHEADPGNVTGWCSIPVTTAGLTVTRGQLVQQAVAGRCPAPSQSPESCLTLTPSDAANLLTLDPFYGRGQAAGIAPGRGLLIAGGNYGEMFSASKGSPSPDMSLSPVMDNPLAFTPTVANTLTTMSSASQSQTESSSITNIVSNSESEGASVSISKNLTTDSGMPEEGGTGAAAKGEGTPISASFGLTLNGGDQTSTTNSIITMFGDSTAVSSQIVSSATVKLDDIDNASTTGICPKCHNPLPVTPFASVYLDRQFGTFMFQDAGAPGPPPTGLTASSVGLQTLRRITSAESNTSQLSDVPQSSPRRSAIAEAVALGLMTTSHDMFRPAAPLGQAALASGIAAVFHITAAQARAAFTKVHAAANNKVTVGELSTALAQAFGLKTTAGRKLVSAATGVVRTSAAVTRAQAAAAFDDAVENHCLAGCKLPATVSPILRQR